MRTSQNIYEIRRAREKRAAAPWAMAYIAVFWVGFLVSLPSHANQAERSCNAFGDVVYQIAKRRDEGFSRFEVRELMHENFEGKILELGLAMVEMVFTKPHSSPAGEANAFVTACIKDASYERTSVF